MINRQKEPEGEKEKEGRGKWKKEGGEVYPYSYALSPLNLTRHIQHILKYTSKVVVQRTHTH